MSYQDSWYTAVNYNYFMEHPVCSLTKSRSLIKNVSEILHLVITIPTFVLADSLGRLG